MKVMILSSEKERKMKNSQTIFRKFLNVLEVLTVIIYIFKVLRILTFYESKVETTDLYFDFSLNNEMGVIKN